MPCPRKKTALAGRSGSEDRLGKPAGHSYSGKAIKARTTPAGMAANPMKEINT